MYTGYNHHRINHAYNEHDADHLHVLDINHARINNNSDDDDVANHQLDYDDDNNIHNVLVVIQYKQHHGRMQQRQHFWRDNVQPVHRRRPRFGRGSVSWACNCA